MRAAVIQWTAGNGLFGAEDRVRRTLDNEDGPRVNPFFRDRAVVAAGETVESEPADSVVRAALRRVAGCFGRLPGQGPPAS